MLLASHPYSRLGRAFEAGSKRHTARQFGRIRHAHAIALPAKQGRRQVAEAAQLRAASSESSELSLSQREPEDVRGAIAIGLSLYEDGNYQEALNVFEKALNLPGTGVKRYRDKPRLISEGEKQSVLYNIACCYSRLEDTRTGLVALAGCLESGYDNTSQLRTDPDLEFLRKDAKFEGLIERFKLTSRKGFFSEFLKGFNL